MKLRTFLSWLLFPVERKAQGSATPLASVLIPPKPTYENTKFCTNCKYSILEDSDVSSIKQLYCHNIVVTSQYGSVLAGLSPAIQGIPCIVERGGERFNCGTQGKLFEPKKVLFL